MQTNFQSPSAPLKLFVFARPVALQATGTSVEQRAETISPRNGFLVYSPPTMKQIIRIIKPRKTGSKAQRAVTVIGAGLGGLTAAAYLAKAGVDVTVVEKQQQPGGYASFFKRPGSRGDFNFDVSLHQTAALSGASLRVTEELGLKGKPEHVKLPSLGRILTPDFDTALPQTDPEGLIRALSAPFPEEKAGIASAVSEMVRTAEETASMPDKMRFRDYLAFPKKQQVMWKIRKETLADALSRHVKSPEAKALLSFLWGYYGLPPSKLSAFYYFVATGQYIQGGGYCYRPHSAALSRALVETIEANGGRIILGQKVKEIIVQKKVASGVVLEDGRRILSDAVISNACGPETFSALLPPKTLPRRFRKRTNRYRPSLSTFVVWLGLNCEIQNTFREYGTFVMDGPCAYDLDAAYQACLNADAHNAPYIINIFDNAFPGYSPPGSSVVSLTFLCGYAPFKRFEADYFAGRKAEYQKEKERLARIMIERAQQRIIPELSRMIEVMEIGTPLTNVRYTGNSEGAVYGYEQSMDNSFMNRIKNRTPIKRLYLAGAWGEPGGGYTGVLGSGRSAFFKLMEDWGEARNLY
jgi:all-trans-retinol 13,14-reductase